jgi:signal transduction histidine kinase
LPTTAKAGATPFIFTGNEGLLNSSRLRYIAWARAALALSALALSFLYRPDAALVFRASIGGFLVYAVVVAFRSNALSGNPGLLTLAADTVFFLVLASLGSELLLWLAAAVFLYLLAEALIFYSSLELVILASICGIFGAVLPYGSLHALEPTVIVAGALACGCAENRQRQKQALDAMTRRIGDAQKAADKARDDERQRIASDFHDGPLQSFISLQMRLEILRKVIDRDLRAGLEDLQELQRLAQGQVRDLRTFLHSMRPVDVEGGSFVATARRMAESFQKESGVPVTFLGGNTPVGLPPETATEVLQMVRESLVNAQKHAGATRVALSLEKTEKGLDISIEDNGHGFPFAGNYTLEELDLLRLGPASLKRRARSLNAELLLESRPGRGAGLKFRIPLQ